MTQAVGKWQSYFLGNYRFYKSQVWDPTGPNKETPFVWFIWHKAMVVNEWRAHITPTSISKQCIYLPS